jgi:5-hydroxyisourate hydrolase
MPGLSIHVVDVSRGVVAAGMMVEVFALDASSQNRAELARGAVSGKGTLDHDAMNGMLAAGLYEAVFHIADYYRAANADVPPIPFLGIVTYRFGIDDPRQHYHLPFKCTPWGYSCFRGGA